MAKVTFVVGLCALLLLAAELRALCPSLQATQDINIQCSFNNCSSLTCRLPAASGLGGDLIFMVEECVDPIRTTLLLDTEGETAILGVFHQSKTVHLGLPRTLSLDMSRNSTHLSLEINSTNVSTSISDSVLPLLFLPINANYCMCQSLEDLVDSITPTIFIHTCTTNQDCNGFRCHVSTQSGNYFVEVIILPCDYALEVVVEDANLNHLYSTIFNETGNRDLLIDGTTIGTDVVIIPGSYSMNISAGVYHPFVGDTVFFPLRTVILDQNNCPPPNLTTVVTPPVPTPLPMPSPPSNTDSFTLCYGLYEAIRNNYTEPFICDFYLGSCDLGITCTLFLFVTSYQLNITIDTNATQYFVFSVADESGHVLEGKRTGDQVSVSLPSPDGSYILFNQTSISSNLKGFQIGLLFQFNGGDFLDILLPHSYVLLAGEPCYSLLSALSDPSTSCTPLSKCSGLRCNILTSNTLRTDDAMFVVEKCVDPVVVQVTIITQNDTSSQHNLTKNANIYLGGSQHLSVEISRNATDLNFTAYIIDNTHAAVRLLPVIPSVLVPLNANACMCASVQHLAKISGHNFIVNECTANQACDGVRCLLGILGDTYYLEMIVLPCEDALEILVEDSNLEGIDSFRFNQSEIRDIMVEGFSLTVNMTLIRRDYSMFIRTTVTDVIFKEVEVIPPHIIILDRTHCNHRNFPTAIPATQATTPSAPGPDKSKTCAGFYDVIKKTRTQPFTCVSFHSKCEDGIKCQLKILDTSYTIIISVSKQQTALSLLVRDTGDVLLGKGSSGIVDIILPKPQWSNLTMVQKYNPRTGTVGLQFYLNVFALSGQPRRDVLIAYTEIPLEETPSTPSKSTVLSTLAVSIIVPVFAILVGIIVVMTGILLFLCQRKKKLVSLQHMRETELEGTNKFNTYQYSPAGSKLKKNVDEGDDGGCCAGGEVDDKLENFF